MEASSIYFEVEGDIFSEAWDECEVVCVGRARQPRSTFQRRPIRSQWPRHAVL